MGWKWFMVQEQRALLLPMHIHGLQGGEGTLDKPITRNAQTRFETTSKQSNDPSLSRVNTLGSGEDNMKLMELMAHYTTLSELKSEGCDGFHQIIDFLTVSHIKNALTECPILYASHIEQFWQTAALSTNENGGRGITATIDRKVKVFESEASIRRHPKFEDSKGLKTLPTAEIFEQLALMGYVITSDSLTFQNEHFSPQWKFFIHTILHCLSPKKTAWEQFCSNIATAIICLATNRTFNISNLIFEAITYNAGLTKPIKRVKKLVQTIKTSQARRRAKVVISDDEEAKEDHSNQGRSLIEEPDLDALQLLQMQLEEDKVLKMFKLTPEEVSTGSDGVSTTSRLVSTADISIASELDSTTGVKAKDKGKAIMHEFNAEQEARFKAEQEQERIDFKTALELQKQYHTLQNRPFSVAEVRKNMCLYLKNQGGYKMSHFKGMIYEDIRPIFERVWDQNQAFIPMGSEIEKEVMKRLGFDLQQEYSKPVEEQIVQQDDVIAEQAVCNTPIFHISAEGSFGVLHVNTITQA
ncbi:hypothetical protein Tco_0337160 [Tanacetum coccineum]